MQAVYTAHSKHHRETGLVPAVVDFSIHILDPGRILTTNIYREMTVPEITMYINYCSKTNLEKYEFTFFGGLYPSQRQHDSMHFEMLSLRTEVGLAIFYPIGLHCL